MHKILFVFGTRPEAIKLCPVVLHLRQKYPELSVRVCVTAQHRHLLDQVLKVFQIEPEYDLNCMKPGQSLFQSTSRILSALEPVLLDEKPDLVLVQGDTTSTLCGAVAGFYAHIPVGHVEAGLRTGDLDEPFPEELNSVLTGRVASLHFAATEWAAENLLKEGVAPEAIRVREIPALTLCCMFGIVYARVCPRSNRCHSTRTANSFWLQRIGAKASEMASNRFAPRWPIWPRGPMSKSYIRYIPIRMFRSLSTVI
jgi:hypothetical protein